MTKMKSRDGLTQSGVVAAQIRRSIVLGQLQAGVRLTIEGLASQYQVSAMPVREALHSLQGENLVAITPNRGARVLSVDRAFVENLYDIRSAIEVMLMKRAAVLRRDELIPELERIEDDLENCIARQDYEGVLQWNREFHDLINAAAQRPESVAVINYHIAILAILWERFDYRPERFAGVASDHRHIIRALKWRDGEGLAAIIAGHIVKARNDLLELIDQDAGGSGKGMGA